MKNKGIGHSNTIKRKYKIIYPVIDGLTDIFFIFTSFIFATPAFSQILPFLSELNKEQYLYIIFSLWGLAFIARIVLFFSKLMNNKKFQQIETSEALATSTMLAQNRANEAKARTIQQITYGHVPEWHPINFQDNVLVYDVHEQLRTILIEIRDAVLDYAKKSDTDMLTVDLAYCYPDDMFKGTLPTDDKDRINWRIITSGDSSCMNYNLHDFLSSKESFYFHLDQNNYVFFNDKQSVDRYYIPSGKDREYGGIGSIVGMTVSLKNDTPESVLVKAMLTITTYGWRLCDDSPVSEKVFKDIFKRNVLNGYKSLLKSELSQMYIRHMVRDKKMCRFTGITFNPPHKGTDQPPRPPFRCPLDPARVVANCPYNTKECQWIDDMA